MNIHRAALIFVAGMMTASCSQKSAPRAEEDAKASATPGELVRESQREEPGGGEERQPDEDQVAQDCAAFVRATKVVPAPGANTDCPACPAEGTEVLSFREAKTDAVSCSGDTCSVTVTIRAVFNPGSGESIGGGLTGWIPPEQRSAYLRGQTPAGEQAFRVQITYKHRGAAWQAIDFDRAPAA